MLRKAILDDGPFKGEKRAIWGQPHELKLVQYHMGASGAKTTIKYVFYKPHGDTTGELIHYRIDRVEEPA